MMRSPPAADEKYDDADSDDFKFGDDDDDNYDDVANNKKATSCQNFVPIWLPHWPA